MRIQIIEKYILLFDVGSISKCKLNEKQIYHINQAYLQCKLKCLNSIGINHAHEVNIT